MEKEQCTNERTGADRNIEKHIKKMPCGKEYSNSSEMCLFFFLDSLKYSLTKNLSSPAAVTLTF